MKSTTPQIHGVQVRVAETQPEFVPVTVVRAIDRLYPVPVAGYNAVVMAFKPTEEERLRIAAGEDIYVSLLTWAQPQQGIRVLVGPHEMEGYVDTL